eukprot:scaffold1322_cov372-Pavlova_lutheri.AAC.13
MTRSSLDRRVRVYKGSSRMGHGQVHGECDGKGPLGTWTGSLARWHRFGLLKTACDLAWCVHVVCMRWEAGPDCIHRVEKRMRYI